MKLQNIDHIIVQGVLADYRAAQALAEAESQAIAKHRQQVLTRMVEGAKVQYVQEVMRTARSSILDAHSF